MAGNFIGVLGIIAILGIAVLFSSNRKAINLRIVGAAFALQAVTAAVVVYSEVGKSIIETMSNGVQHVMNYSREGIDFVFGGLAAEGSIWSFAINVLPIIIFFSALTSVLYHLRIMQPVVKAASATAVRKAVPIRRTRSAAKPRFIRLLRPIIAPPLRRLLASLGPVCASRS